MLKEEWQKIFFGVFLKRDTLTLSHAEGRGE